MRKLLLFLLVAGLAGPPASAICLHVVPESPVTLGATTYLPWNIVRYSSGVYSLALPLPAGTALDALHRMDNGDWLFSVEAPTTLGGTTYQPSDVIRIGGGGGFAPFFCGAASGVPLGVDVDAAYLFGGDGGRLRVSFDVPVTIGATTIDPADLAEYVSLGGCTWGFGAVVFNASATVPPVPISDNVTAADQRAMAEILGFDVPTTLGAATFLPGDLVSWNGAAFTLFEPLAGWPVSSFVNALSFLPNPGAVQNTLMATKVAIDGSTINIAWGPSCSPGGAEDYGIYEGAIGTWYSHSSIDCNDALADLNEDVGTMSGNRYYLVVPFNCNDEGSYGTASSGAERPVGAPACVPSQVITSCP
jgi:hypothetical protein